MVDDDDVVVDNNDDDDGATPPYLIYTPSPSFPGLRGMAPSVVATPCNNRLRRSSCVGPRARQSARASWYRAASRSSYTKETLVQGVVTVVGSGLRPDSGSVSMPEVDEDDGTDEEEEEDGVGDAMVVV